MRISNVLVTNGGQHSPETWALGTARHLTPFGDNLSGQRELAAQALQTRIAEALVPHHGASQDAERDALAAKGADRYAEPHDHAEAADKALSAVVDAAKGTPWEAQFASSEWQAVARGEIAKHFETAAREEREWHAHRNTLSSEGARAYLAPKYASPTQPAA